MILNKFYKVYAILLATVVLAACSKSEDFSNLEEQEIVEEIEIGLSLRGASLRNQEIPFLVFDDEGNEFTESAEFFVDGTQIATNVFSSSEIGDFEVYATYDNSGTLVTTPTQTFSVVVPKRKVVIEDHTGTWCGYCPDVTAAIERVHEDTDDIAVVAIHNNDAMTVSFEEALRQEFEVFGFPTGRINRTTNWNPPYEKEDVTSMAGEATTTGIGISSRFQDEILVVTVSISSEEMMADKKLVVYLLEDEIIADQTNYFNNDETSPYFNLGDPIVDFVHEDVLRATLTDPFGDAITATAAFSEYEATFTSSISSSYDRAHLKLIAMVVDADNNAINAQVAPIETTKNYE